jgi:hypothetical protein
MPDRPIVITEHHQIAIRICFTFTFKALKAPLHSGSGFPTGQGQDTT